jgi:hypothetical protein
MSEPSEGDASVMGSNGEVEMTPDNEFQKLGFLVKEDGSFFPEKFGATARNSECQVSELRVDGEDASRRNKHVPDDSQSRLEDQEAGATPTVGETSMSGVSGTNPGSLKETLVGLDGVQHELNTPEDMCVIGGESQQYAREDFDPGGCDLSLGSKGVEFGGRYLVPEQSCEPAMPLDTDTLSAGRSLDDIGVAYGRGISSDDDASDGGKAIRGCPGIHEGQARCLDCKGLEPRAWSSLGIEEAQTGSVSGTGEGRSGIG